MSARRFAVAAGAALAILAASTVPARAADRPARAPDFSLPTAGGKVTLASLRGKVVLVDFWASWCGPCRGSFPWMADLKKRHAAEGLEVVAINLDKDRPLADAFLAKYPAGFTVAFDPSGATAESWHVAVMPTSFVVGRDGQVIATHTGFDPKKAAAYEARIVEALHR